MFCASADGTINFVREYPNEQIFKYSLQPETSAVWDPDFADSHTDCLFVCSPLGP